VPKLEAMIEVISNKALTGDARALATIVQIGERLDVFNSLSDLTIDTSGYNLIMKNLEALGYGRPKSAAGNEAIELQQPASNDDPILPRSTNQKPDGIFGSDK
jgi:hypothetical protein